MATSQSSMVASGLTQDSRIPAPVIFEKVLDWEGVRIGHYRLEPGRMSERAHRNTMVFVPLSGSITIEGSSEGTPAMRRRTVGDISVTPPGIRYSTHWEEELEYLSVSMAEDFLNRATVDFEANRNAKIVLACGPQDALVRSIAIALAGELDSGMPTGKLYTESLINTLAVHLLRHYSTESLVPDMQFGGLQAHKLRRVTDFIEANLERDLALVEIAAEADLSLYHFARAFKQTTGLTPIQFLMQKRIERAKHLLSDSELPLSEIALNVGFKNQSHFTTLFRKFTEMTPKAWRNSYAR